MPPRGIWHSAMENWPAEMINHLPLLGSIALAPDDMVFLRSCSPHEMIDPAPNSLSHETLAALSDAITAHPAGVHVKLGLCSFKGQGPLQIIETRDQALALLTAPNRRVASVIDRYLADEREAELFIFPWIDIEPWQEFRLFVRDHVCVGVSQYHTQHVFPEIDQHYAEIKNALEALWYRLSPDLHMDNTVIDVRVSGPDPEFQAHLIELNPFIWRTDPCLFNWRNGTDFDGSFRYHKSATPTAPTPAPVQAVPTIEPDYWTE